MPSLGHELKPQISAVLPNTPCSRLHLPASTASAVAFYGHYDIQPAEEPDWRTNPFEMTAVDGYLCGRGTSDNKGPMLAFIYAVKVCDCWCLCTQQHEVYHVLYPVVHEEAAAGHQP